MAVFTAAAMSLRRSMIIDALKKAGAFSAETAKALSDTDLVNPDSFPEYTRKLVDQGVIHEADGRYFVER